MRSYDTLYDEAAENYGLITTEMAGRHGVSGMSLVMLERRGRLRRVGRGVYRLEQHPITEYDAYATLVAKAGKDAFLWGPTVLAMEKLCPTDPAVLQSPGKIPVMALRHQIAQKLHGASGPNSQRAHDLIDLQLIMRHSSPDLAEVKAVCRRLFAYRQMQSWPPAVVVQENWETLYANARHDLPVLPTVGEAVVWVNDLVAKIDVAK